MRRWISWRKDGLDASLPLPDGDVVVTADGEVIPVRRFTWEKTTVNDGGMIEKVEMSGWVRREG